MAKFTDDEGRDWLVRVDVTSIRNVRENCNGLDLGSLSNIAETFVRMADDPELLCNVLYVVCEKQATERNITDGDFGHLLLGDVIENATMALEVAITDFFPQKKRLLLQRLREKVDRVQAAGLDLVTEKLESADLEEKILAAMKQNMETAMNENLTQLNSATNSPESSE